MPGPVILDNPQRTDWICADCGHEQRGMGYCQHCGSGRTSARFVFDDLKPNWRAECFGPERKAK